MLINFIRCSFTTRPKFPKGSIGKENTLGNNFSFPRHKELFNSGYYDGEEGEFNQAEYLESPISKSFREQNKLYEHDSIDMNTNNQQLNIKGGIM